MNYTIYDPTTGQILNTITSNDAEILSLNLQGKTYIEGNYNNEYYIDNGIPVQRPSDPSNGSNIYKWDLQSRSWILDLASITNAIRSQRGYLLLPIDNINPLWFASLTAEQQQELALYRTALLNVPQQAGFPTMIEWPTKPSWL